MKKFYKLNNIGKCIASQIHHPLDRVRGWESVKFEMSLRMVPTIVRMVLGMQRAAQASLTTFGLL